MPASSAAWIVRIPSSWSGLPHAPNIIAPRQRGLTCTPVWPSSRVSMSRTIDKVDHVASRVIQTETDLRELIGGSPTDVVVSKISDHLNSLTRQFIDRSPFVCVATASPDGGLDVSPRGDPSGFVRILDERTLLIPD